MRNLTVTIALVCTSIQAGLGDQVPGRTDILNSLSEEQLREKNIELRKWLQEHKNATTIDSNDVDSVMTALQEKLGVSLSGAALDYRKAVLELNMKRARSLGITLPVSKRALLSDEEKKQANGYLDIGTGIGRVSNSKNVRTLYTEGRRRNTELPEAVNWVDEGVVTPVLNQGQCGGCYAFSAAGSMESRYAIQTGVLYQLSPEQLIACDTAQSGCNGGNYNLFWRRGGYCTNTATTVTSVAPFSQSAELNGVTPTCNASWSEDGVVLASIVDTVSGPDYANNYNEYLMEAVEQGPVSVSIMAACPTFQYYTGGVLTDCTSDCTAIVDGKTVDNRVIDHAVLVVGYNTTGDEPYWLVKNSWGTSWGIDGYIKIAMLNFTQQGANGESYYGVCGINYDPASPKNLSEPSSCGENGVDCAAEYSLNSTTTGPSSPASSSGNTGSTLKRSQIAAVIVFVGLLLK